MTADSIKTTKCLTNQDLPNVVFLLNDHQLHYRHGWDGGPRIQRPNFDRLASEGVNFTRSYAACPLCAPARRTMLTGLYPHRHGEIWNGVNHPYDRQTYLEILADAGYQSHYFGKWHAGPGTAHDFGCEGFCYPDYSNPYTKSEYKEYLQKRGLPEPEAVIERDFEGVRRQRGDRYLPKGQGLFECLSGVLQTPKDTHESFFLANLACDKLREIAANKDRRPFALRVDFWGPHQPYFPTEEFADLYDPKAIPEYASFRDDLRDKPDVLKRDKYYPMSDETNHLRVPNPLPWSEWQKTLALCYAHITMVDAAAGRILDALDEFGLAENTLVIWTTDHGDALGCHGGHFDKRSYMSEELLRVPLAMRFPGRIAPGQVRHELVSAIDLAPTLLDAAGTRFSEAVDGRSMLPLATGSNVTWRDGVMCETHGHFERHFARLLVTERHKYIANQGDMDELYDLSADPYEMKNLVFHADHKEILHDMREGLAKWRSSTSDSDMDLS